MGKEQPPEFYDNRLSKMTMSLEESPWRDLYISAAFLLPGVKSHADILDIGCGAGRFAKHLANSGYNKYSGIDFSPERIKLAREYVPYYDFSVQDIYKLGKDYFNNYNTFVALEIMEHLNKDLELLDMLPLNKQIIFSVPNYDSKGHVRYFHSIKEVKERYKDHVDISYYKILPRRDVRKCIFLIEGYKVS